MPQEEKVWTSWTKTALRVGLVGAIVVASLLLRDSSDPDPETERRFDSDAIYTTEMPARGHERFIHVGTDLYYFNDAVGEVKEITRDGQTMTVAFTIDDAFQQQFREMPSSLTTYISDEDPNQGWIAVVAETESGRKLLPREAAKRWGTGI
jgi:hypothetical protein